MVSSRVIYSEPQQNFFHDVLTNSVANKMIDGARSLGIHVGSSEEASYKNNAPRIKNLLELANVNDTYVTFEYLIPYNMQRIDCMIYGRGNDNQQNVVHIELKQWSNNSVDTAYSSDVTDVIEGNFQVQAVTGGSKRLVSHPSQQVRGYQDYLQGFVEVISTKEVDIKGMAYCYNYNRSGTPNHLFAPQYTTLLKEYRTFAGDEVEELAQELSQYLSKGDGFSIFNKIMLSPIRPSKKLLSEAAEMVDKGNAKAFSLISDQIVAKNAILDKIRKLGKAKDKKNVILIKGGPGTGKTVIALNLLAELAGKGYSIHYATKSKPLLEGVKNRLPRGSRAKLLFSNVSTFLPAKCESNSHDIILIDEAHRISNSANNQYTPASMRTDLSQIDTIIRAGKICVFFIDDKQAIRGLEIGSTSLIRESALKYGADIQEVELTSQFRCNGSNNYLDWLEQVLYNKEVESKFTSEEFDFKIFDTPESLYERIQSLNDMEKGITTRITAGFCWSWSKKLDENGQLVKDVQIGDSFAMPWETHGEIARVPQGYVRWYEWAYLPEGIKQVGCIYTAQGFEFDYIGVIIGPDLYYNQETKQIESNRAASKDPVLLRYSDNFDSYVRNIYRVLMSRGMKGCYVYVCDEALRNYFRQLLSY